MALSKNQIQEIIKLKTEDVEQRNKGLKGKSNQEVAITVGTSERSVRRVYKEYKITGDYRGVDLSVPVPNVKQTSLHVNELVQTAFNKKKDVYKIVTVLNVDSNVTQLMIPDTQCKPDIDMSYLEWLGQYIVDKRPEVIVHIGDHADMPSLSSYDKGKGAAEGALW